MPSVLSRHPRFALTLLAALLVTLFLLGPYRVPLDDYSYSSSSSSTHDGVNGESDLSTRVARSMRIYDKVLKDRVGLITKFGPTPAEVDMFPPDKAPWPPYTVWDFFPAAFNCPHELERIGALGDGGKWVCGLSRVASKPDCIIYSVGINHESSFEAELLSRTRHCQVWGYDFTVNSFGPEVDGVAALRNRAQFEPFGLAGADAHGPEDANKMYTLQSLMRMNGHSHIDILKIDIEGWEFDTLTTLIGAYASTGEPLPFAQLQLEIHAWHKRFSEFLVWWEALEKAGLRPFMTEPNMVYQNYNKNGNSYLAEYSFLNVHSKNVFMHD